jgi:hypothetical protein
MPLSFAFSVLMAVPIALTVDEAAFITLTFEINFISYQSVSIVASNGKGI